MHLQGQEVASLLVLYETVLQAGLLFIREGRRFGGLHAQRKTSALAEGYLLMSLYSLSAKVSSILGAFMLSLCIRLNINYGYWVMVFELHTLTLLIERTTM